MKRVDGIWLPDRETHLVEMLRHPKYRRLVDGKATYQYHKLQAALALVTEWRGAVDVGAHVGLWAMHLARAFQYVACFEPVAAHRECFHRNVQGRHVELFDFACGNLRDGHAVLRTAPSSSGDTGVVVVGEDARDLGQAVERGDHIAIMARFDDVLDPTQPIGFLKVDCEGYELHVLQGAEQLLRRWRPVVCVEQKPGHAQRYGLKETQAVDYLRGLGAGLRREIGGDFIMSW